MKKNMPIHHIGYMVKDITKSQLEFECLGFKKRTPEIIYDPERVCFFLFMYNDCLCVELIQPKDETSTVWKLSKKFINTPYHICFETLDIETDIATLTQQDQYNRRGKYILLKPPARAIAISPTASVAFLMNTDIGMIELLQL